MIFTSYSFFGFLIVVFLVYRLLQHFKFKPVADIWLILSSFYFYYKGAQEFFVYFLGSVFFNYVIGTTLLRTDDKKNRKFLLFIGLFQNLALLGYFKYANFFVDTINAVANLNIGLRDIALPIGISFFTFQLIAYIVDCYNHEAEGYSVVDYLLFITFFPQLIVGPIVHHSDIVPEFQAEDQPLFNKHNFFLGLFIFAIGCGKKILLADPLTGYAKVFFQDVGAHNMLDGWLSSLSYTLSYYFDLSGYADMAIGMGLFFNVKLPENFNSPYKATNFRDYWRRWHMSLSNFLGTYVFRNVFDKSKGSRSFYFATMVTFFVSGFWHGAGWQFIVWGIVNGLLVCISNYVIRNEINFPKVLAWPITFLFVILTRILFVAKGLRSSFQVYGTLIDTSIFAGMNLAGVASTLKQFLVYNGNTVVTLVIAMGIAFFAKNTREITEDFTLQYKHAVVIGLLLTIALVQMTVVSDFLYFQF